VGLSESSSQYFVVFITILLFAIDGLIPKSQPDQFRLSQPLAYPYRLYIMLGSVYLLFMGLTLPFPVPPQAIPIGIFIVAFALNVFLANIQKRV
jgi:hypothetical protein